LKFQSVTSQKKENKNLEKEKKDPPVILKQTLLTDAFKKSKNLSKDEKTKISEEKEKKP
jgi:hypothetical protein